jgi:hypothetical protein
MHLFQKLQAASTVEVRFPLETLGMFRNFEVEALAAFL